MQEFEYRSATIAYERTGDGAPLVFQHGLGADRSQSAALIEDMPGFSVLAADAPSHGDSTVAPSLHSFEAMADAVLAMMDREGIERAVVGGISMGSGIALNLGMRFPDRVHGLILVRPAWLDSPHPANLALVARLGAWIQTGGPEEAHSQLEADPEFQSMSASVPGAAESIRHALGRCKDAEHASVLSDMVADAPLDSMDTLRSVSIQTLVIACETDPLHPVSTAETIASHLPNASMHHVPERYVHPQEHARAVRTSIRDFLGSLGPLRR